VRDPASTPQAAQTRYVRILQKSLSCLTKAIWYVGPSPEGGEDRSLATSESPLCLRTDAGHDLLFSASQRFELVPDHRYEGEWKSRTLAYVYELKVDREDEPELLGWHWHPLTTPDRLLPHVHVRADYNGLKDHLAKLHLPSGRVSFEEIVRLLIEDLGVEPARNDWDAILSESETRFKAFRTWA
jgi:hypothetical protein